MQYNYPHSIENGHGEVLTFSRRVNDETGEWLEGDNLVQPGDGPPMHVHFKQSESLTVIKGKMGIQRPGQQPEYFGKGATVTFEAGDAHRF
jgi:quercetin dioxygenase-like cupin family protein